MYSGGRVLSFPEHAVVSDVPSQSSRRAANLAVGQAVLCLAEGKIFEASEAMRLLLSQDALTSLATSGSPYTKGRGAETVQGIPPETTDYRNVCSDVRARLPGLTARQGIPKGPFAFSTVREQT